MVLRKVLHLDTYTKRMKRAFHSLIVVRDDLRGRGCRLDRGVEDLAVRIGETGAGVDSVEEAIEVVGGEGTTIGTRWVEDLEALVACLRL